ncbi:hypothetical protein ROHU_013642 [Labeo rohita]|uniref:Uncharacterized protein n=1 Tax=Labeo rohita TaxID=84645 RepID=A0A498L3K6_LABRO|nr:hypothetical protein ROHU_013642 [Labeo rohita]
MSTATKIANVHVTASLSCVYAAIKAGADLAAGGRWAAAKCGSGWGIHKARDIGLVDSGWDDSGQGGMHGLMKGQLMVEWDNERQTAQEMLRQPRNTLLWSSVSRAPQ